MPKRIYVKNAVYHINWNTKKRFLFFLEDIFCNILIDVLENVQLLKHFNLLAYKINPDHTHILIQPTGDFNISKILQSIKRISSNHINQIINFKREENPYQVLEWDTRLRQYNQQFIRKFNRNGYHELPGFKWQEGFHDVIIRSEFQLMNTMNYIRNQASKHELADNKFLYINQKIPENIVYYKTIYKM